MRSRLILGLLMGATFVLPLPAQMHGTSASPGIGVRFGVGRVAHPMPFRQPVNSAVFLGDPFLFSDYYTTPIVEQPTAPQVIVVQATPAAPPESAPPSEPLLIEWDGKHYVHVSESETSKLNEVEAPQFSTAQSVSARRLVPVDLVFRDGHYEQVCEYAIVGGILYVQGNYWRDGYWTRKIALSALDLPITIHENRARDITFVLPQGPNQVVTRP